MLRRNLLNLFVVPAFAGLIGLSSPAVAQDKPADKPAEKKEEAKKEAKKEGEKAVEAKKEEAKKVEPPKDAAKADKDVVETAMANKDFSTLCDLLKAGELVDTLKGAGPFTVFAPTNAAFDKLGKEALENLKKDKAKLQSVLKYHVAAGAMMAADVTKAKTIKTVNGAELTVSGKDKEWMVDKAKITTTDIKCKNGVIHVIDGVLMPAEKKDH
jgi:uncharacterized surface protein with fasciclin (FAS1) repeats